MNFMANAMILANSFKKVVFRGILTHTDIGNFTCVITASETAREDIFVKIVKLKQIYNLHILS